MGRGAGTARTIFSSQMWDAEKACMSQREYCSMHYPSYHTICLMCYIFIFAKVFCFIYFSFLLFFPAAAGTLQCSYQEINTIKFNFNLAYFVYHLLQ